MERIRILCRRNFCGYLGVHSLQYDGNASLLGNLARSLLFHEYRRGDALYSLPSGYFIYGTVSEGYSTCLLMDILFKLGTGTFSSEPTKTSSIIGSGISTILWPISSAVTMSLPSSSIIWGMSFSWGVSSPLSSFSPLYSSSSRRCFSSYDTSSCFVIQRVLVRSLVSIRVGDYVA